MGRHRVGYVFSYVDLSGSCYRLLQEQMRDVSQVVGAPLPYSRKPGKIFWVGGILESSIPL